MTSDQTEQGQMVLDLVEQLPELQRQVVWFRIHDQLTFKEIAGICNESINTILSRMHKAKRNLALKMKSAGIETGVIFLQKKRYFFIPIYFQNTIF